MRALLAGAIATLVLAQVVAPPALSYDPEAWLVWGRELWGGTLDVTAGPAIKPLPMLIDAGLVATVGADAAWHVWSLAARAAVVGAVVVAARLVFGLSRSRTAAAIVAAAVLATPTMLRGALEGASEPAVLLAILVAARFAASDHLPAAVVVLGVAGLVRPEALVLAGAVLVVAAAQQVRERRDGRLRALAVAMAVAGSAPLVWLVLQGSGGGSAAGAVSAATALREGQPGLAARPALATLRSAVLAVPWLVLLAAAAVAVRAGREAEASASAATGGAGAGGDHLRALPWLGAFAALWTVTVVGMSEAGFSGETRYLAPGIAAGAVAIVGWCSVNLRNGSSEGAGTSRVLAAALAGAAVVLAVVPAVDAQHDRARAQADLERLLAVTSPWSPTRCPTLAVPRYLRPALAWRAERPISSMQSPALDGTDCALQRDLVPRPGPRGTPRRLVARSGEWSWWTSQR